jgi:hypothetical protein
MLRQSVADTHGVDEVVGTVTVNFIFAVFEHAFGKGQRRMGRILYDRSIL